MLTRKVRRSRIAALAALLLAEHAAAAPIEHKPRGLPTPTESCPIHIGFGAHAGADVGTIKRVTEYIEASSKIERATVQPWGREGERVFCVFPKPEHLYDEFEALKAIVDTGFLSGIKKREGEALPR